MLLKQILIGVILILIGAVSLKFNYQLVGLVRLRWLESKMGPGSSYLAYKIFSVLLVLAGVILISGQGSTVFGWILSPIRHIFPH